MTTSTSFSVKNALRVLLVLILVYIVFANLVALVGLAGLPSPVIIGGATFIIYGFMIVVVYYFAKRGSAYPWRALGFKSPGAQVFKSVFSGIAVILAFSFLYSFMLGLVNVRVPDTSKEIIRLYGTSTLGLVVTFMAVAIVAPIAEEVLFRGYLYPSFKNNWGPLWANLLTSALFALVHVQPFILLPVFFFIGIVLAYVREKDDSVVSTIIIHSLNNTAFFVLLLLALKQ